jgi:3-phosphoshikimate 1-carboxyvinyltransferase
MTLQWLDRVGLNYTSKGLDWFKIPGGQSIKGFECDIPGDFSTASFFICGGVLAGRDLVLEGLDINDSQGDKAVIEYLRRMGADIEVEDDKLIINKSSLKGVDIDLNATPDALPALAVTACFADGPTKLYNVPQARSKETDRISVMRSELSRIGGDIEELEDGLIIRPARLKGGKVDGHGDHRVVMSLALAGLVTDEPVVVSGSQAAAITFPEFVGLMRGLGADLAERN